ncbi:putative esterase/lipase [Mycoplasmopsis bovigenitalium]|uniref:Putative esterase/lipase n=1 Tax=Mycoplasmopsis bovigenitalium TaxID=2112 RepID=A0A449A8F0_9BACT|nr:alpha/beta hydrolase [Mycoplasmopsis bovigenitalium]VEU60426.1 putative esterase/lipase [Mycoplasmopsis bovigenitalium]
MIRKQIQLKNESISYLTDEKLSNIVVLFLHGFGDDATRATTLFQCKNRLYSIVSIDMPGCGKSSNNVGQPTLQYYCDIVGEFIDKFLPDREIYIVTHSLGTIPALYNATNNPKIKYVFGVAPAMPTTNALKNDRRIKWMLPNNPEDWYDSQFNLFSEFDNEWILRPDVKQKILDTPQDYIDERKRVFSVLAHEIFAMTFIENVYKKFFAKNKNFTAIVSRNDKYINFSDVENYINLYNLGTYELNDSGHAMFYKNTQKIHNYINNFIIKKEGLY